MIRRLWTVCVLLATWGIMFSFSFSSVLFAQLEPDKRVARVGRWEVSTARWGVGCVASYKYSPAGYEISISGEKRNKLTLLVTVDPNNFGTKLNGSEEDTSFIEIAFTNSRWGNVKEYGYRGTSGVVLEINDAILKDLSFSKAIKITERGQEKVRIDLSDPKAILVKLMSCFERS